MLQVGDGIIAVDDEDVRQMTGSKASKYIAYKNHELLELTILRESQDSIDNKKAEMRTDE
jgi:C-terminal processing protease CtpA/Prc